MESKAKIIPSIRYNNCEKAIDWLCEAFDFEIYLKVPSDNGGILHAQLIYNDCMIMLGSAHEGDGFGKLNSSSLELEGQNTASVYMVVADVDAHYKKRLVFCSMVGFCCGLVYIRNKNLTCKSYKKVTKLKKYL